MRRTGWMSAGLVAVALVNAVQVAARAADEPPQAPAPQSPPLESPPLPQAAPPQPPPAQAPVFKPEEIEQIVAPVALYPDPLLAQVLMASTYPLEVVEAARWQKQNPTLKDKALQDALQKQSWDPSVKSLTAFPPVLTMMNDKLDWTQKLGDAFLAQQNDVMDAVQRLRLMAEKAGNLKSTKEQTVTVEPAPPPPANAPAPQGAPAQTTIVKIEPANPQVVYVPTYNPTVVYGSWPSPSYPPYSYYPPGYVATASLLSFGAGMAVGAALWGNCSWGGYGHNDVNVNVNNYNNFNKANISNGNWQHNVDHRKGVGYRDTASRQRYGQATQRDAASREAFRGRAEQGQRQMAGGSEKIRRDMERGNQGRARDAGRNAGNARPNAPRTQPASGTRNQPRAQPGGGTRNQPRAQPQRANAGAGNRGPSQAGRGGAFQDMGNSTRTRADSDRGRASRQSAANFGGNRGGGGGGGGGGRGGGRGR